ncbi:hypothetical protein Pmgp_02981 [Pelotomaculum propionicicum]|uniref:Uncharacterized protein n=1 Tax=Pelotomaculum propionicicum TaxID=258475 RepID=A0A4Y7RLQ5_9FIRM|nr:hypothetical protein Pmgp_02981 [Pelotomaculum propionicicum]
MQEGTPDSESLPAPSGRPEANYHLYYNLWSGMNTNLKRFYHGKEGY